MNIFGMVTTKHSREYTDYALRSFLKNTPLGAQDLLYLIDNDQSFLFPPDLISSPIEVIQNENPLSFAANVNQIMQKAAAQEANLFFLNNDIIFPPGWLEPLLREKTAIVSSVSNSEIPYQNASFICKFGMDLSDYLGHEQQFEAITQYHHKRVSGYKRVHSLPFYCVKIPHIVYRTVGPLDETFGPGGAEDKDYCIRAYLEGFEVQYALDSYVLHFQGKSTWRGAESAEETRCRDKKYVTAFHKKWGEELLRLFIFHEITCCSHIPGLQYEFSKGNYKCVIEGLRQQ